MRVNPEWPKSVIQVKDDELGQDTVRKGCWLWAHSGLGDVRCLAVVLDRCDTEQKTKHADYK